MVSNALQSIDLMAGITIGGIVAAFLFPIAMQHVVGVPAANWSSGADALWGIFGRVMTLAVFVFFAGVALEYAGRR